MSHIINELAIINVNNEMLQRFDMDSIRHSFEENDKKLDDLKKFRTAHDKQNLLMRWWHSDKLKDAQLDSSEVQAEFLKTIGQLMVISIMQSKKLFEQQGQLNDQQGKLKMQADGIADHTGELQKQHRVLTEQSTKLETLVHEYFALKGLTEDGAQRLIEIAGEVKAAKVEMQQEFVAHSMDLEVKYGDMASQMTSQVNDQITKSADNIQSRIVAFQQETREALIESESTLRKIQNFAEHAVNEKVANVEQRQHDNEANQQAKNILIEAGLSSLCTALEKQKFAQQEKLELIEEKISHQTARTNDVVNDLFAAKTELASYILQQQVLQKALTSFHYDVSRRIKRLRYVAVGLFFVFAGMIGIMGLLRLV